MDRIRTQMKELKAKLAKILETRGEAMATEQSTLEELDIAFKTQSAKLKTELDAGVVKMNARIAQDTKVVNDRHKRRTSKIEAAYTRMKTRLDAQARTQIAGHNKKQSDAHAKATQDYEDAVAELRKVNTAASDELEELKTEATNLKVRAAEFVKEHGLEIDPKLLVVDVKSVPPEMDTSTPVLAEKLKEVEQQFNTAHRRLRRRMNAFLLYMLVLLVFGGAGAGAFFLFPGTPYFIYVGVAMLLFFGILMGLSSSRGSRAYTAASDVMGKLSDLLAMIERQNKRLEEELTTEVLNAEGEKIERFVTIDDNVAKQTRDSRKVSADQTKDVTVRRERLIKKIAVDRDAGLARCKVTADKLNAEVVGKNKQTQAAATALFNKKSQETVTARATTIGRLQAEWKQGLDNFKKFHVEQTAQCRKLNPPWSSLTAQSVKLPTEFPSEIYCGDVMIDLNKICPESDPEGPFSIPPNSLLPMPLVLTFPALGSIFVRSSPRTRDEASKFLFTTVLRLMCSLPPNKSKLTIVDPVGLGQNFSALMHLADYDESLVGGKIWSDVPHIEKELTELTEHIEKVIQKYLRNRYETIDDFNKEAGTLSEPYRFLVIADFPSGFNEAAADRLASIISSGAKCGVYTLILHDDKQKLPASVVLSQVRRNGMYIEEREGKFVLDDDTLLKPSMKPDEPPAATHVDALVNAIGKQCQEAARVQVPFDVVLPKEAEIWSLSTEKGFRLPLGKAGADRLQYMQLGKDTMQHALIAGKTGSGKSNLFHVIISNAAMWYGPKELEFYLLDFKKGVEFKTYGLHHLPHARVIAVESDRDFGLSVLKKLDQELTRRGELFRQSRVQDYPSYRKTQNAQPIPRSLLVIDEFQEYFVEDDTVAQDASLLLDRIVRQGRAFGIHMILGSQTLGGSYSLPKTTLGQMGVRIALACNESDSHLILSDDNSAASLSRPGEAIYNDMAGLVEGNNPFQAVYIDREKQDFCLKSVEQRALKEKYAPAEAPIIFEGSKLCDLRENPVLLMAASRQIPPTEINTPRIWLGEANAIKGPTEAQFIRQAGNNLLVVGQRADGEMAMCCSTLLSLAAENTPDKIRMIVFDGSPPDSGSRARIEKVTSRLPHTIDIIDHRRVPEILEELTTTLKARQEDGTAEPRIFLLVLGLDRFRMLRDEDEFSFGGGDSGAVPPAKAFINLVTEGPGVGIHTAVWCDTLGNLKRTVQNKTLKEFEMRVLFQMSANDSSELIDSPAANRLGMYNGLLFTTQTGNKEKFRPYQAPESDFIAEVSEALKSRSASHSGETQAVRTA